MDDDNSRTRLIDALARTRSTTARVRLGDTEQPDQALEEPIKVGVADLTRQWMRVTEAVPEWARQFADEMSKLRPGEQPDNEDSLEVVYDGAVASLVLEGELTSWPSPAFPPLWLFEEREKLSGVTRAGEGTLAGELCERFDAQCPFPAAAVWPSRDVSVAVWIDPRDYVRRAAWHSRRALTTEETEAMTAALEATSGMPELEKTLMRLALRPSSAVWEVLELWDFGVPIDPADYRP